MGVFALNLLHSLFRTNPPMGMPTGGLIEPFQLLLGPLLYLFMRKRIEGGTFTVKDFLHGIPFGLVSLALLLLTSHRISGAQYLKSPFTGLIFWICVSIQISAYFMLCFHLGQKYNHSITDYYSATQKKDLRWINSFMLILAVIYIGYLCLFIILFHTDDKAHFERLLSVIQSLAVYGLGTFSLFTTTPEFAITETTSRRKKTALPQENLEALKRKVITAMEEKKLYLDPELTLPDLATKTGIPRNTLSELINDCFNKNFYDFINFYRVAEIIRLMGAAEKSNEKLLTLAFEAGFNSKPAFNAVFRKITGQTPSSYRKNQK